MDKEPQVFIPIELDALPSSVQGYKAGGWRLGQMCATAEEATVELVYTFIKAEAVENLVLHVAEDAVLPSISGVYLEGFFYENEVHDLFGVQFSDVAIDYTGKFYRTSITTPQNPKSTAAVAFAHKAAVKVDPSATEGGEA
jgi:ech hydrogenase subunit D